ncbi:MAG: hypothetical protein FJ387_24445 [Verrucomicrobia bacterium]|nr:hypothetical protein [Verrucomicrobiota bacterium]
MKTAIQPRLEAVAVLGAGTMGSQISFTCAKHGYAVRLMNQSSGALETARAKHRDWAAKEMSDALSRDSTLARISYDESLERIVAGADLVIESLPENLELKCRIFAQLDALCPPEVILTSNSSSLRMSRIEMEVKGRERVCNLHFFPRGYQAIEVMGGSATSAEVLKRVCAFATSLGLTPFVPRRDSTGFLIGRLWHAVKREALREYSEGLGAAEELDRLVHMTWGWPLGVFGAMDHIGLDVIRDIENVYFEESGDPKDKPPAFLDEMIARGELGVKTGKGFYCWTPESTEAVRARIAQGLALRAQWEGALAAGRERFVGTWKLVSFENRTAEGEVTFPFGEDATGCLIYTAAGRMSVMLSKAGRAPFGTPDPMAVEVEEKAAAFESCIAYAGTYEVGEGRIIHRLEQCTLPNWIGSEQMRFYRFEGDRLILETPPTPTTGRETVSRLI